MIKVIKRLWLFVFYLYRIKYQKCDFDFLIFFQSPHLGGGHTFLRMIVDFFKEKNQKVHFVFEQHDFTERVREFVTKEKVSYSLIPQIEEVYHLGKVIDRSGVIFCYSYIVRSRSFIEQAMKYPSRKIIVNVGWPLSWFKAFFIPKQIYYFQHVLPRHDLDAGNLFFLRFFCRFYSVKFVGVSRACSLLMKQNWKIPASRVHTLYHYNYTGSQENKIFSHLPSKIQNGIRIVTASRVEDGKDPELWLRIAKRITAENPLVEFLWAGEGSYLNLMRGSSKGYDRIFWVGQVNDISRVFRSADIYFEPSKREAFGLSILEAMSFGLPVLSTKCGGPEEVVQHGKSGYLGEIENEVELYSYLVDLIADDSKRVAFGEAGREICHNRFSKEIWNQELSSILNI